MTFYKNNAYPDVNLHDCNFQIKATDDTVQFWFPQGVGVEQDGKIDWTIPGMIRISNCPIDELSIYSVKHFNFLGIHCKILREITLKDLNKIFENGGFLQVFDEYYCYQQFIWKCAIFPS